MVEMNWASFLEWKQIYEKTNCGVGSPFNDAPLTEDSIYLWNEMSAPLPSGATNGVWGIFPESKSLAGFLRYVVLPKFFEIWLVRDEWDDNPERFINAEELFELAELAEQSVKCRYIEDIRLMKALIADLDALMDKDNEKVGIGLVDLTKKFNGRWEDTPTWCFKLKVYENPVSVGKEIFNRVAEDLDEKDATEEFGMPEDVWMEICKKALTDKSTQKQFTEKLSESAWF